MSLYHCNRLDLQSGDLVQPGNWGTVLQQIGPQHNAWNREMVLEAVRSMHFPNKPSRLHGTFPVNSLKQSAATMRVTARKIFSMKSK
jgi:hypothetical protein